MSRRENQWIPAMIKAGLLIGMKPTEMFGLLRKDLGTRRFKQLNAKLIMAYQTLQDELCNGCGMPVWLGHSTDRRVQFKVKKITCYSCATLERDKDREQKTQNRQKNPVKRFGETKYVVIDPNETDYLLTREEGFNSIPKG